ncbi:MAG: helix-turn-helix domain-containing protein [Candidatus Omnitrophica bacterium]|nr:helix-turn-helix domain-containing protein [Candidatus Omnitrophota bacterium]
MTTVDLSQYLTVREAAKKLDLTEERVRELINLKEIRATKIKRWRIAPEDLEEFVRSRRNK